MARNIYLVGSVPMADASEVFETVGAALGPRIKRLPDGETGARGDWITWLEPVFSEHPAFVKSGEFFRVHASGTGRERYSLKPGLQPADVRFDNLFYADIAKRSYADFKRLKEAGKIPASTKFQVDLVPAHSVIWLFLVDALHAPIDPVYNDAVNVRSTRSPPLFRTTRWRFSSTWRPPCLPGSRQRAQQLPPQQDADAGGLRQYRGRPRQPRAA